MPTQVTITLTRDEFLRVLAAMSCIVPTGGGSTENSLTNRIAKDAKDQGLRFEYDEYGVYMQRYCDTFIEEWKECTGQ